MGDAGGDRVERVHEVFSLPQPAVCVETPVGGESGSTDIRELLLVLLRFLWRSECFYGVYGVWNPKTRRGVFQEHQLVPQAALAQHEPRERGRSSNSRITTTGQV